ncbi:MAG: heme biosynthesis protein HemY [Robiginitomaculum sp.]|nr:MAG: heme biosynthesis protein HemY [Robiginitomaculum sp.]
MARYLILPLILILGLLGLLVYVGDARWVQITLLENEPASVAGIGLSLRAAIIGAVGLVASVIILWSLGAWLWRLPKRMKTGFGRQRQINGLDALEESLLAGEAGDGERARKQAKRVRDLLDRPALSAIVSAKAAEAAGNTDKASDHYKVLLETPKTETAGRRGLARLAVNKGDHRAAIEMTKSVYSAPKGPTWAFDILFGSQVALNDWDGALETLALAEKRKHIDKLAAHRRKAVLLSAKAAQLEKDGKTNDAIDMALQATETSQGFAPAAALAARLLAQNDQAKKAANLLEKSWSQNPHPALALAYRDLFAGSDEALKAKKIKGLIKANPDHRESALLSAEEALRAKDGVEALQVLGGLLRNEDPSARLCALASAAEELLGNTVDARLWHFRASTASIEANWSDLDPDGPAFNYTQTDWQRLVMSYGETGELIHPRHETFKRRRAVVVENAAQAPEKNSDTASVTDDKKTENADTGTDIDDKGINLKNDEKKDLSERLDNLLDETPKT